MNNILLIIQREYLTRVKKKSFIVMTILGPLLMGLMYAGVIWAAISSVDQKKIEVLDESKLFDGKFKPSNEFQFVFKKGNVAELKKTLKGSEYDALVHIPANVLESPKDIKIYSEKGVTLELQNKVENAIEKEIETIKLTEAGITKSVLESAKMDVSSETISLKEGGEEKSSAAAASIIGGICAFLIYLSVFIYGAQVMRSITEEKTSRIVEVLISSVKPFQLMIGKIVGVALVGLTQFGLWIILSAGVLTFGSKLVGDKLMESKNAVTEAQMASLPPEAQEMAKEKMQAGGGIPSAMMPDFFGALDTLPLTTIIVSFLFYFVGGYLLYSALFGAVGSAVDSDTDTQQFMLPITIPIIAAFMIAQFVIRDPNSNLAIWTSMIPFTSPIIMMVRIPFGVPIWQIVVSVLLLIGGFMFTTWLAARIYRVGILMYGKKVTWKELGKWIFYKS
ncbi:MAG TPA: ABC transporter permease [Leadbetterella sp.]|jgi:ABC-2 type transport system permease protein|nr:ABC transporter permease [Leadbetterella sp.]